MLKMRENKQRKNFLFSRRRSARKFVRAKFSTNMVVYLGFSIDQSRKGANGSTPQSFFFTLGGDKENMHTLDNRITGGVK